MTVFAIASMWVRHSRSGSDLNICLMPFARTVAVGFRMAAMAAVTWSSKFNPVGLQPGCPVCLVLFADVLGHVLGDRLVLLPHLHGLDIKPHGERLPRLQA